MKSLKKIFNGVFVLLVLQFALPQDLVHLLSGHDDTVDLVHNYSSRLNFENEHQHCLSLQFAVPPFLSALNLSCDFYTSTEKAIVLFCEKNIFSEYIAEHPVRGPPALSI